MPTPTFGLVRFIKNEMLNRNFPGITAETREVFLQNLRRDFPRELVPIVLAPWLYPEDTELSMDKLVSDATAMSHAMVRHLLHHVVANYLPFMANFQST